MKLGEFKSLVNTIRPNSDAAADMWWEWSKELEEYNSPDGKPSGEKFRSQAGSRLAAFVSKRSGSAALF